MNVIISGASQGIGYEVAVLMAKKGHKVLAIARNEEKLKELAKESDNILFLACDLVTEVNKLNIQSYFGDARVDVIINNAGQLINKPFLETELSEFQDQYNANVLTAVNLIKSTHALMPAGAHIVNISSMGGVQGSSKFSGLSAYSSAKGALSILTECLAEEFKQSEIHVNALALGAVQTNMLKTAFPEYEAPLQASEMGEYIADFALKGQRFFNGKIIQVALGNP